MQAKYAPFIRKLTYFKWDDYQYNLTEVWRNILQNIINNVSILQLTIPFFPAEHMQNYLDSSDQSLCAYNTLQKLTLDCYQLNEQFLVFLTLLTSVGTLSTLNIKFGAGDTQNIRMNFGHFVTTCNKLYSVRKLELCLLCPSVLSIVSQHLQKLNLFDKEEYILRIHLDEFQIDHLSIIKSITNVYTQHRLANWKIIIHCKDRRHLEKYYTTLPTNNKLKIYMDPLKDSLIIMKAE